MTKGTKIGIWAGVGALLIGTGIYLYSQFRKLMNYEISFNRADIKSFNLNKVDIDLGLNFVNKSNLKIELERQKYDVYINDVYMTSIVNNAPNILMPNSKNVLSLNIGFNPSDLKSKLPISLIQLVANFKKQKIRVDFTFYVKFGIFTIPITYSQAF